MMIMMYIILYGPWFYQKSYLWHSLTTTPWLSMCVPFRRCRWFRKSQQMSWFHRIQRNLRSRTTPALCCRISWHVMLKWSSHVFTCFTFCHIYIYDGYITQPLIMYSRGCIFVPAQGDMVILFSIFVNTGLGLLIGCHCISVEPLANSKVSTHSKRCCFELQWYIYIYMYNIYIYTYI